MNTTSDNNFTPASEETLLELLKQTAETYKEIVESGQQAHEKVTELLKQALEKAYIESIDKATRKRLWWVRPWLWNVTQHFPPLFNLYVHTLQKQLSKLRNDISTIENQYKQRISELQSACQQE